MNIANTRVETVLKSLLQKNLKLSIGGKQYRKGKFLLFKQNNYYIEMTVKKNDVEMKRFEIPIPFNIEEWNNDGLIYFDYRLTTLADKNKEILNILKLLPTEAKSKFYNKILEIKIVEEEL